MNDQATIRFKDGTVLILIIDYEAETVDVLAHGKGNKLAVLPQASNRVLLKPEQRNDKL